MSSEDTETADVAPPVDLAHYTIEQLQRENAQLMADREEMGNQMAHQAIELETSISKHWEGMFQTGITLVHQSEQLKLQTMEATVREVKEAEAAAKECKAMKQQELKKQMAEYDNKLAAFISQTSFVVSAPQRVGPGFPQASPVLVPHFIEELTREQRLVEVTRTGDTRIPTLVAVQELVDDNMGIPTPANSAPDQRPANSVPNPQKPFESIDWDDPRVSQRVEGMMARQQQQGLLTDEEDLKWKVRQFGTFLPQHAEFASGVNLRASDEIVEQANEGHLAVDATSPFYFRKGYATAFYNQQIIDVMVEKALKMRAATENRCGLPNVSGDYLKGLIHGLLKDAQRAWKQHQPRMGETTEQARMRAEAYEAQRATRVLSLSRKTQKLEGRICVMKKIMHIETAKKSQETAKNWQWILELLEHLGTGGMSSEDDIDAETVVVEKTMITTVHLVKICPWHLEEVTKYLHWIDRAAETATHPISTHVRNPLRCEFPVRYTTLFQLKYTSWNFKRTIHELTKIHPSDDKHRIDLKAEGEQCSDLHIRWTRRSLGVEAGLKQELTRICPFDGETQAIQLGLAMDTRSNTGSHSRWRWTPDRDHCGQGHRVTFVLLLQPEANQNIPMSLTFSCIAPESKDSKLPTVSTRGPLTGHYCIGEEINSVINGWPYFVLQTPSPKEYPPLDFTSRHIPHFDNPTYMDARSAYLMFIPKHDPWHWPLLGILEYTWDSLPIEGHTPGRWECTHCCLECQTELSTPSWLLKHGLWCMRYHVQNKEVDMDKNSGTNLGRRKQAEGIEHIPWQVLLVQETGLHASWIDLAKMSVAGDWTAPRVGGLFHIGPTNTHDWLPAELAGLEWLLDTIIDEQPNIPLYFHWGALPSYQIHSTKYLKNRRFLPDLEEMDHLQGLPSHVTFNPWKMLGDGAFESCQPPALTPSSSALHSLWPLPPSPALLPSSLTSCPSKKAVVKKQAENSRRSEREGPNDRQARAQREAHTQKGFPLGKKGSWMYYWEKESEHYICHAAGRGNYEAYFEDYLPTQSHYDPFKDEWDLCSAFGADDRLDDDDPPDDNKPVESGDVVLTDRDLVPWHDWRDPFPDDNKNDTYYNERLLEVFRPTDAAEVSGHALTCIYLKAMSSQDLEQEEHSAQGKPIYEWIADNVLDTLSLRFGFVAGHNGRAPSDAPPALIMMRLVGQEDTVSAELTAAFFAQCLQVSNHRCRIGSDILLLHNAADILEIICQGWGPGLKDVTRHLLLCSMAFWMAIVSSEIMYTTPPTISSTQQATFNVHLDVRAGLGYRARGYNADNHGYHAYLVQRNSLLHTSRGSVALQYAGVISRLARSQVSEDDLLRGPSKSVYETGVCLWDRESSYAYWYDSLTDREIGILCGVYHVGTGEFDSSANTKQMSHLSWWPKPNTWASGNLYPGWWTPHCEEWYQNRVALIAQGDANLLNPRKWKHGLKYDKRAKECLAAHEQISAAAVLSLLSSA
ncbi:hypothetical protein B0H14DRAFT_2593250 [Mycena olivaceomarginata]|nr:hypothetical protein B0H14DRAFT_2593250 [Mycena olivaceomarginata]